MDRRYGHRVFLRGMLETVTSRVGMVARVETNEQVVALTFDDGPDPVFTPLVLDVLAEHHASATFFLDGPAAERHPDLVRRIRDEGHVVGSHGWAHESAAQSKTMHGLRAQVKDIRRAGRAIGRTTKLYRPPYGHESRWTRLAAAVTGHQLVYWSVSVKDWDVTTAGDLARRIRDELAPGAVVLLHDRLRHATNPEAFNRQYLIDALAELMADVPDSIRFVTVPELIAAGRPIVRHRRRSSPPLPEMVEQLA